MIVPLLIGILVVLVIIAALVSTRSASSYSRSTT